ncbi:MAG: HAD hydrolase family protein [Clostridia bacterium]|nr:HAD hydrolase family protein [Clostridia bacterium]
MKIKMLVMDVDGTLTDGHIYMGPDGETMKAFSCKDGHGIGQMLPRMGIVPVIITGRSSKIVANRARELHIEELYQGVADKLPLLRQIAAKYGFAREEIAYIGDDLNDWECLEYCGLTGCPRDAEEAVREIVGFVAPREGGRGAVRDFIEYIAKL